MGESWGYFWFGEKKLGCPGHIPATNLDLKKIFDEKNGVFQHFFLFFPIPVGSEIAVCTCFYVSRLHTFDVKSTSQAIKWFRAQVFFNTTLFFTIFFLQCSSIDHLCLLKGSLADCKTCKHEVFGKWLVLKMRIREFITDAPHPLYENCGSLKRRYIYIDSNVNFLDDLKDYRKLS